LKRRIGRHGGRLSSQTQKDRKKELSDDGPGLQDFISGELQKGERWGNRGSFIYMMLPKRPRTT
uniref:Uncharacterized protein n=1 Tax=Oncorhynchus tshawytscha TaxID=74940 RepID=A0AAZ3QI28_ONCTS